MFVSHFTKVRVFKNASATCKLCVPIIFHYELSIHFKIFVSLALRAIKDIKQVFPYRFSPTPFPTNIPSIQTYLPTHPQQTQTHVPLSLLILQIFNLHLFLPKLFFIFVFCPGTVTLVTITQFRLDAEPWPYHHSFRSETTLLILSVWGVVPGVCFSSFSVQKSHADPSCGHHSLCDMFTVEEELVIYSCTSKFFYCSFKKEISPTFRIRYIFDIQSSDQSHPLCCQTNPKILVWLSTISSYFFLTCYLLIVTSLS